jgi:hypothetical protein
MPRSFVRTRRGLPRGTLCPSGFSHRLGDEKSLIYLPLFWAFLPTSCQPIGFESGRGQSPSGTRGKRVATFALVTTIAPQPSPATSTPGEPGRAADRQAFASLPYPTNRQVLRNPHVGRPGFLVSMSMHPRTAVRPGRCACLLLTPNCQRLFARSRHTEFTTRLPESCERLRKVVFS